MSEFRGYTAVTLGLSLVLSALVGGTASWFVTQRTGVERARTREHHARKADLSARLATLERRVEQVMSELERAREQQGRERADDQPRLSASPHEGQ